MSHVAAGLEEIPSANALLSWYKQPTTTVFDPTHMQFTHDGPAADWEWEAEPCFHVADHLALLEHETVRMWGGPPLPPHVDEVRWGTE